LWSPCTVWVVSCLGKATVEKVSGARQALGWDVTWDDVWHDLCTRRGWNPDERRLDDRHLPGRVARIDRGWSTVWFAPPGHGAPLDGVVRVRNIGADVAVGDWVVVSEDFERVDEVLARRSAFKRRASFEGQRAEAHVIAANIDVVFLLHALISPPNQRRLERELVLAFDSGAQPVLVLTKLDLMEDPQETARRVASLESVAPGVPVHVVSGIRGDGIDGLRGYASPYRTVALLGASGVGKSTIVNYLVGNAVQSTAAVRENDQRGRHTTTAVQLVALPSEPVGAAGWLIDTPGVRAVSLWSSGTGIERAFADIFELSDHCRFRDCKHEDEPDCAVRKAVLEGSIDPRRLDSMKRLVAEEAALEEEQRARLRVEDRRGFRRRKPPA
jgi:ribosome biogenesis GTPase / thiamine phosphate phosphatase